MINYYIYKIKLNFIKMFIKRLDYLSPPITFYYQGSLSHPSIISGIISIISIMIILFLIVHYSFDIFERKILNAFYFKTFIDDAGIFPLNASSLFHFISLGESGENYWREGVDFTRYRIIGFNDFFYYYLNDKNLSRYDHWLYGNCNNDTDTKGISHLINYKYFGNSACIRKYFNSTEQKYYDTESPKFRWPVLANGTFHENNLFYSFIVEECKEDSINIILGEGHKCNNDPSKFLSSAYLYFINNYVDVLNNKNPNTKFLDKIENGIPINEYFINNLNFNPSKMITHNGLILDNIKEEKTIIYERNDVMTEKRLNKKDIYIGYIFWLKNTLHYYERTYKRIQDIISNIGGISQVIVTIAFYINNIYNKYIVLGDTESLLFSSIKKEKQNKNLKKLEKREIKNYNEKEKSKEKFINMNKSANNFSKSSKSYKLFNNSQDRYQISKQNIKKSEDENKKITENNNIENNNLKTKNEKKNFFYFILFKLFCEKKYKYFKVYTNFRIKIISEEYLIKNHLNIYNLLRATENKRKFKKNSYQLKDLIKLI